MCQTWCLCYKAACKYSLLALYPSLLLCLSLFHSPLAALNPTVQWDVCFMTYNLQFTWLLHYVDSVIWSQSQPQSEPMQIPGGFHILSMSVWARFCDFMISFPASLSLRSLPLGSRAKVGRERERHGPETPLKSQPLFKWGSSRVHYSAFLLLVKKRAVEINSRLISDATMA